MARMLLSDRVYHRLYTALLKHRIKPGDRLNRRQVAADLGVSVAPVLEAMTQLEWEGFLETTPRRGTVVRQITARQVLGRFHLRLAIEVEAARLAAGPRFATARAELLAAAHVIDDTVPVEPRETERWTAEITFHSRLVACAGCEVLSDTYAHVMRHSLFHAAYRMLPERAEHVAASHATLVERLAVATPDEAEALVRAHLEPWIRPLTDAAEREEADAVANGVTKRDGRSRPGASAGES